MDTTNEFNRYVVYNLNLEQFNVYVRSLCVTLAQDANAWYRVEEKDVQQYLTSALKAYIIVNNREMRMNAGIFDTCYRNLFDNSNQFLVPRFFRDIFREMSRIMINGYDIYIPKVDYKDATEVDPFKALDFDVSKMQRIIAACNRAKLDSVPIQVERVRPVPYSVWVQAANAVYSSSMIPQYREIAVTLLRHNRFIDHSHPTSNPPGYRKPSGFAQSPEIAKTIETHATGLIEGVVNVERRTINGNTMFVSMYVDYTIVPFIGQNSRFPTDEVKSNTPPGTPQSSTGKRRRGKSKPAADHKFGDDIESSAD